MRSMTPQPLSWIESAPLRVTESRRIAASASAVWAVLADHASWPQWFGGLKAVVPGAVAEGVGGTREVTLGPVTVAEEFLAWEPEKQFAFTLTGISGPPLFKSMVENIVLTADGPDATTITYTQAALPLGGKVGVSLLGRMFRKALVEGLAGLDARVTR